MAEMVMHRIFMILAGLMLFQLLLVPLSRAHPHVFMFNGVTVVFDQNGLSGFEIRWAFDEMFSSMIILDFDKNRNGRFEPSEIAGVEKGAFSNFIWTGTTAHSRNPFMAEKSPERVSETPAPQHSFLLKITLWQQQLKGKMAALIRQAKTEKSIMPLMVVILMAFGYGALHAAGPGHGKAVAMSFMLSGNATMGGGLLFGALIALFHGLSGILCVLGLRYILQQTVFGGLGSVSHITQRVSFSLISLLGLAIIIKNGYCLFSRNEMSHFVAGSLSMAGQKRFLPWALAVGLVPCPGVVMVLLFCLSMDAFMLGLLLGIVISLGMAATIDFVIVAVVLGKDFSLKFISERRAVKVEQCMGIVSGLAVTTLGVFFLILTFV